MPLNPESDSKPDLTDGAYFFDLEVKRPIIIQLSLTPFPTVLIAELRFLCLVPLRAQLKKVVSFKYIRPRLISGFW